jgi:hypothetical protein
MSTLDLSPPFTLIPLPLLRTISTGFILLFSYVNIKYAHHIHPHLPFAYAHSLPLVPTLEKTYFILPSFIFLSAY